MQMTSDHYAFVENAHTTDEWHIKIKQGEYAGIIFKYGKIEIKEPEFGQEDAILKFDFKVVKLPEGFDMTEEDLNGDEDFMNFLGKILVHIIEDAIERNTFKLGNNDKPTDSEPTLHE